MEAEIQFYQFSVTLLDLSVYQTIVHIPESERKPSGPIIRSTEWDKVVSAKHSLYASRDMDEVSDFIVPDGLDTLAFPTSKASSQAPKLTTEEDANKFKRSFDQTLLYTALDSSSSVAIESTDVNIVIDHWKRVLAGSLPPASGTL